MFQPIGVVICSAIALGFIPPYSCSPNFSELDRDPLPSCNNVSAGTNCCTRASNQGWRYLLFTLGGITLGIFILRFFVFRFKESPKFLIYKGRDVQAMQTVEHIAKVNKQECHLSLEAFKALEGDSASLVSDESTSPAFKEKVKGAWRQSGLLDFSRYKMLFDGWPMTRLTVLVWLTYIMDFWGFTVAGESSPCFLAPSYSF